MFQQRNAGPVLDRTVGPISSLTISRTGGNPPSSSCRAAHVVVVGWGIGIGRMYDMGCRAFDSFPAWRFGWFGLALVAPSGRRVALDMILNREKRRRLVGARRTRTALDKATPRPTRTRAPTRDSESMGHSSARVSMAASLASATLRAGVPVLNIWVNTDPHFSEVVSHSLLCVKRNPFF